MERSSMIDLQPKAPPALGPGFWAAWLFGAASLLGAFAGAFYLSLFVLRSTWVWTAAVIVFTLALIALAMVPQWVKVKRGIEQPMRPPYRRYMFRFLPAMIGYTVLLMLAVTYWQANEPTGLIAWLVALAPTIPILFAVRAIALLLKEEDDEYWRARQVFAHTWATNATLALCAVYGFLDMFELVPNVDLWAVFPLWAVCLVPAQLVAKLKLG
jgi:MFS family permease